LIYSWSTPDIPKYEGWEKIGYTEQASAATRTNQQASQLSVAKVQNWSRRALFTSEAGGAVRDGDFHAYLRQLVVERELSPSAPNGTSSRAQEREAVGESSQSSGPSRVQVGVSPSS
jgi:hypothetical protein